MAEDIINPETNEDQPIDQIPEATTIVGSKILGVDVNGEAKLFEASAVSGASSFSDSFVMVNN